MSEVHSTVLYRPIAGFPPYRVGDDGSVWSNALGSWRRLKPVLVGDRLRPAVRLYAKGQAKLFKVHRLVLLAFVGPCPDGMEGAHEDGDRMNNRLSNLEWKTHQENMADSIRHGTMPCGERRHLSKMEEAKVKAIFKSIGRGQSQRAVARKFGVSQTAVGLIARGKTWKHLKLKEKA